ncbi:DUF2512 family protein [Desmospora profundinema]|uniref:DUF2512 family protein n=1 Tax=Desmospora profundinema TaxID=1571184 RepID=A0ABU1IM22_9BACL|nr:DUF2512 family protein [Desmospora profundinema]MDR6225829.1 hypothetical protein [Desmospora profundinema]
MAGFIVKLIVCPLTVIAASFLFPNVQYSAFYQPVIIGLILAAAAHMMEIFLLREETTIISTVLDFFAAALIVYVASMFFVGARVTFFGALLTALLLTITEIIQHRWLIQSGRTRKSPTES